MIRRRGIGELLKLRQQKYDTSWPVQLVFKTNAWKMRSARELCRQACVMVRMFRLFGGGCDLTRLTAIFRGT